MVMNHQGYSAYPSEAERMREAIPGRRIPYGSNAPQPDQGQYPNELARQYAHQLLHNEKNTLVDIMRSIIERAYMAGWSAALDTVDRREAERSQAPLTDTGIQSLAQAVAPLIQKIVHDALVQVVPPKQKHPITLDLKNPTTPLPPGWKYIMHTQGSYPCHKPAFILIREIQDGEFVDPSVFRYLSGLSIPPDARSTCGSCLQEVHPYSNADLDWRPHIISNRLRTVAGHFITEEEAAAGPTATVDSVGIGSGDYGFPSVPDPRFDVETPNDIPDPQSPGEFSALELQEILRLKAEADAALNNNPWPITPMPEQDNGRNTITGS